jgi:hypothetical protein
MNVIFESKLKNSEVKLTNNMKLHPGYNQENCHYQMIEHWMIVSLIRKKFTYVTIRKE